MSETARLPSISMSAGLSGAASAEEKPAGPAENAHDDASRLQGGASPIEPADADGGRQTAHEPRPVETEQHTRPAAAAPAPPAADDPELESCFGLRGTDQLLVAAAVSGALVFSGLFWAQLSGWGTRPIEIDRPPDRQYAYKVDVNTANWVEWMQLPDVGETLARRIVKNREERGPFQSIDDLQRVHGIGPRTVERLRPWLREPVIDIDAAAPAVVP